MGDFSFFPQSGPVNPQILAARQRMAQAMMQQGMSDQPTTALGALARAIQGGVGGWAMNKANQDYQSGVDTYRQRLANALNTNSPNDMAAAVTDPFGDPNVAMKLPDLAHNQQVWTAQNHIAQGQATPGDYTLAYPQQAGEFYYKQKMLDAQGDAFDKAYGQGGGQPAPQPVPGAMPQAQPPAFAPLPGSPGAGGQMPMPSQAPQMGAQGQSQPPQQPPIQNAAQPPQPNSGAQGLPPLQVDAQGFPNRPVTDPSELQPPPQIIAQARMAAQNPNGNGMKDGADYIRQWQENTAKNINDNYYKGAGYIRSKGTADADAEFEKSKGAGAANLIQEQPDNYKKIQNLSTMIDLFKNHGDSIVTGPLADRWLAAKEAMRGFGFDVGDKDVAAAETISKLGNSLATTDARLMGARTTQFEFKTFQKNNPGLTMTPEGNLVVSSIKLQQAQRDYDLANLLQQPGVHASDLPKIAEQYDRDHPFINPLSGKPLDDKTTYFPAPKDGSNPQNIGSAATQGNDPLSQARAAIAAGADPAKVRARLQQNGIDPSGL